MSAATPETAGAAMLVPEAKQTFRVVVPRQLLTTASYQKHSWVMLLDGERGGAGLMARVQKASLPFGEASQVCCRPEGSIQPE